MSSPKTHQQDETQARWPLWLSGFGVLLLDQGTKEAVNQLYPVGWFRSVIPGCFNLVHLRNTGAAWSMFSDYTWILGGISAVALILLMVFFRKLSEGKRYHEVLLALIAGGIAGNMIDRLFRGSVIDFLDFHWKSHHYPAFNVADSFICVCMVLLAISLMFEKQPDKPGTGRGA